MTEEARKKNRIKMQKYRAKYPEKCKEHARRYYYRHQSEILEQKRLEHKAKGEGWRSVSDREYHLRKTYGLTIADYNKKLEAQNGVCSICYMSCKTGRRLTVDHCHKTGKVRGLLCVKCNRAIGLVNDDPGLCINAAEYLAYWEETDEHKDK